MPARRRKRWRSFPVPTCISAATRAALDAGHSVIVADNRFLYFDYAQAPGAAEPIGLGPITPIRKTYDFDPTAGLGAPGRVLGVQAVLWTEYVPDAEEAQRLLFPRLATDVPVDAVRYTRDGAAPTSVSRRATKPIPIQGETRIQAAAFVEGRRVGPVFTARVAPHRGFGRPIRFATPPDRRYFPSPDTLLVDGRSGCWLLSGCWQSFVAAASTSSSISARRRRCAASRSHSASCRKPASWRRKR